MPNIVVNSTPIISLCIVGKLELLEKLYGSVMIPEAVFNEINAKPDSIAKKELDKSLGEVQVCRIKNEMAKTFYKFQLHDGEVEVMILTKGVGTELLIIDDKNAKKHAKYLGFNVTGTLGVLIKAKRNGYIKSIKPLIEQLLSENIYTSIKVKCPTCEGIDVTKYGKSSSGKQRYYCHNKECRTKGFQLEYVYKAYNPGIDKSIIAMTANASGIRDISRVLEISTYKVMSTLKKQKMK